MVIQKIFFNESANVVAKEKVPEIALEDLTKQAEYYFYIVKLGAAVENLQTYFTLSSSDKCDTYSLHYNFLHMNVPVHVGFHYHRFWN